MMTTVTNLFHTQLGSLPRLLLGLYYQQKLQKGLNVAIQAGEIF